MKTLLTFSALFLFSQFIATAQHSESSRIDTAILNSHQQRYNPRKAMLYAAVLPGMGQVYNKKYWKLPLVYGGIYALGRFGIKHYNDIYKEYRSHLFSNIENGLADDSGINKTTGLTTLQLRRISEKNLRDRDLCIILMAGVYLLQIADAHVDAHLKEFDLNPNLQVSVEPVAEQNVVLGRQTGVALVFKF